VKTSTILIVAALAGAAYVVYRRRKSGACCDGCAKTGTSCSDATTTQAAFVPRETDAYSERSERETGIAMPDGLFASSYVARGGDCS